MAYIDDMESNGPSDGCFLCAARDADNDRRALVVLRRPLVFAVLNRFPYNNGHTLVVPNEHKGEMDALADDEMLALMTATRDILAAFRRTFRPDGFNVGINFGRSAGAGLPGHLHLHIVPRWSGDTNFMTVLGETKVIPQSLEDSYDRVVAALGSST